MKYTKIYDNMSVSMGGGLYLFFANNINFLFNTLKNNTVT